MWEYLSFISFCETYWLSIYKEEEAENPWKTWCLVERTAEERPGPPFCGYPHHSSQAQPSCRPIYQPSGGSVSVCSCIYQPTVISLLVYIPQVIILQPGDWSFSFKTYIIKPWRKLHTLSLPPDKVSVTKKCASILEPTVNKCEAKCISYQIYWET